MQGREEERKRGEEGARRKKRDAMYTQSRQARTWGAESALDALGDGWVSLDPDDGARRGEVLIELLLKPPVSRKSRSRRAVRTQHACRRALSVAAVSSEIAVMLQSRCWEFLYRSFLMATVGSSGPSMKGRDEAEHPHSEISVFVCNVRLLNAARKNPSQGILV